MFVSGGSRMLTCDLAEHAISAAKSRATDLGISVNIAVLDAGGYLKAFTRMDRAILASIDVAIGKARTAVLLETTSEDAWDFCKPGGPAPGLERSNGGLVTFAGGIPIRDSNQRVIGAVGISGGTVAQDLAVAKAAIAAVDSAVRQPELQIAIVQQGAK
jgi:uncharacterized protein GlcG (DUF336 family)